MAGGGVIAGELRPEVGVVALLEQLRHLANEAFGLEKGHDWVRGLGLDYFFAGSVFGSPITKWAVTLLEAFPDQSAKPTNMCSLVGVA